MPNAKQLTAAGLTGLAAFIALTTFYYINAARLSHVPDEPYPTYDRTTMENWIVEIANRYNCTATEFTEKLVNTVIECTGQNATNPFFKDEVHEAIRSNLTFPAGNKPNPEAFRGTMMLTMSAFALAGFGIGGFASFGIVLGLLVGLAALGKLLAPCVRSTTQQVFSSLNIYHPQNDVVTPALELEEMSSNQAEDQNKTGENERTHDEKDHENETPSTDVTVTIEPSTDATVTIKDGSSTKEEDATSSVVQGPTNS